jgi:hypothetical protein
MPPPIDPAPPYAFESHCRPSGKCYSRTKESLEKETFKNKHDKHDKHESDSSSDSSDSEDEEKSNYISLRIPKMYLYILIFIIIQVLVTILVNKYLTKSIMLDISV